MKAPLTPKTKNTIGTPSFQQGSPSFLQKKASATSNLQNEDKKKNQNVSRSKINTRLPMKMPQKKNIETPRFKINCSFQQPEIKKSSLDLSKIQDTSFEYFSFGDNTSLLQEENSTQVESKQELIKQKDSESPVSPLRQRQFQNFFKREIQMSQTPKSQLKNGKHEQFHQKDLNSSFEKKNIYKTQVKQTPNHTKSKSFHLDQRAKPQTPQKNNTEQEIKTSVRMKTEQQSQTIPVQAPVTKNIQIFNNNNYNIININDTLSSKEKKESLRSLQKQFQQILQTQQLLESRENNQTSAFSIILINKELNRYSNVHKPIETFSHKKK